MDVLMPQLGETVAEGKITKWFKAAGDAVKPGDNLFEIETDKTSMEVPSTTAGTLTDIRFKVGEVAKVGAVVAVISGRQVSAKSGLCRRPDLRSTPRSRRPARQRLLPRTRRKHRCAPAGNDVAQRAMTPPPDMDPCSRGAHA